ncbi:unnamed protein product [Pleuronectes platessa]|uniref:Secreted protein n=1 Tax=Pleuronectes platessa TaxID=8262 RepID=A0A9N7THC1_PLEPL|nr:unnamed protein product [Pleuronectes platessa]
MCSSVRFLSLLSSLWREAQPLPSAVSPLVSSMLLRSAAAAAASSTLCEGLLAHCCGMYVHRGWNRPGEMLCCLAFYFHRVHQMWLPDASTADSAPAESQCSDSDPPHLKGNKRLQLI